MPPAFYGVLILCGWGALVACAVRGDPITSVGCSVASAVYSIAGGMGETVSPSSRSGGRGCVVAAASPRVLVGGSVWVVGPGPRSGGVEGVGGFGKKPRGRPLPTSTPSSSAGGVSSRRDPTTSRRDSSPGRGSIPRHVLLGSVMAKTPIRRSRGRRLLTFGDFPGVVSYPGVFPGPVIGLCLPLTPLLRSLTRGDGSIYSCY